MVQGSRTARDRGAEDRVRHPGKRIVASLGRQTWARSAELPIRTRTDVCLRGPWPSSGPSQRCAARHLARTSAHPHVDVASWTGAVATSVALDAASLLPRGGAQLRDAAGSALAVGILGSVGAGITGATDWQHTHEDARRVGLVHGLVNTVATGLYAMSWWDRRRGRLNVRAMAGSAVGYGLTLGAGYLGGA